MLIRDEEIDPTAMGKMTGTHPINTPPRQIHPNEALNDQNTSILTYLSIPSTFVMVV